MYVFNENEVCTNPDKIEAVKIKHHGVTVSVAQCSDGLWNFGLSIMSATWGQGYGVFDEGRYTHKKLAIRVALNKALGVLKRKVSENQGGSYGSVERKANIAMLDRIRVLLPSYTGRWYRVRKSAFNLPM